MVQNQTQKLEHGLARGQNVPRPNGGWLFHPLVTFTFEVWIIFYLILPGILPVRQLVELVGTGK